MNMKDNRNGDSLNSGKNGAIAAIIINDRGKVRLLIQ